MGRSTWFRGYAAAPQGVPRLLCLPHAGGSASFYHPLARRLGADVETLAVQYPGRQDRRTEEPVTDIGRLAGHVVAALDAEDDRPLALFGHSMGAVVAFETARQLSAAGRPPAVLIVSGRRAPSRQVPEGRRRPGGSGRWRRRRSPRRAR
ncbi:alpha/beta fold hydrolase, partial [Streptomyces sp. NPDC002688]|uniref:thioesterase II family protein n=1 Tax=Streptomyces sp. NPDC002688 TaxID=3154423 RepID=UPI0033278960